MVRTLFLTALCITAFNAQAEMYKCTDTQGSVSFQAQPCSVDQVTNWSKETESERRDRTERERLEALQQKADKATQPHAETNTPDGAQYWTEIDTPEKVKTAVMSYLNQALRDPDSLKDLAFIQTVEGVRVNQIKTAISYRATNAYGGYVKSEKVVTTNQTGEVVRFKDYLPLPLWRQ